MSDVRRTMHTGAALPTIIASALALVTAACATSTKTPSAAGEQQPRPEPIERQIVVVSSIELTASAEWHGDPDVLDHTTPIRMHVENHGASPLRLLYQDFRLVGNERTYFALPPFEVDGETEQKFLANPTQPMHDPLFQSNDYYLLPSYGAVYPHLNQYSGSHPFDASFYRHHYAYWQETPLPTTEMLLEALPEGVIETGGRVNGYLYFELAYPERDDLLLEAKLTSVDNMPLGIARVRVDVGNLE